MRNLGLNCMISRITMIRNAEFHQKKNIDEKYKKNDEMEKKEVQKTRKRTTKF